MYGHANLAAMVARVVLSYRRTSLAGFVRGPQADQANRRHSKYVRTVYHPGPVSGQQTLDKRSAHTAHADATRTSGAWQKARAWRRQSRTEPPPMPECVTLKIMQPSA